jgi:tetratricopeptide (TPR) repeat protein
MRFRLGRYDDALKDLSTASQLCLEVGARAARVDAMLDEAVILDWTGDWVRSRTLTEQADAFVAGDPTLSTPHVEARLLMARARICWRTDRQADALALLRRSVEATATLGDEAYETHAQSLSMVGGIAATLGLFEESERSMSRCLDVLGEHGDMIGLAGALQNRCTLSLLTDDMERLQADLKRIIQISREFGFSLAENIAVKDLGEICYLRGQTDEAEPHARRAIEMYRHAGGDWNVRLFGAEALLARIVCYRGDVAAAEEIVRRVVAGQAEARASGRADALFSEGDRASLDAVDLVLRAAPDAEFDALVAKGRACELQPQDVVEMMEWKGLSALRAGRSVEAVRFLEESLAEADKSARLASHRIRLQLARARAAADSSRAVQDG